MTLIRRTDAPTGAFAHSHRRVPRPPHPRRLDQRWFPARKAPVTDITFSTLGVPAPLVAALAADGKTSPFPIQVDTLPDTLAGRDVLGRGKTGSGKTLAFSIPMAARLGGVARRRQAPPRPSARPRARPDA